MNIINTVYLGEYDIKHNIADRYKVDVRNVHLKNVGYGEYGDEIQAIVENVPSKNLIDIVKAGGIDER